MDTIKFSDITNKTTEQHNLTISKTVPVEICGKTHIMYSPCNLNIFVSNSCHNYCNFCINRHQPEKLSTEQFLNGLEKMLGDLSGTPIEATITGGEPTINPERFVETLSILHKHNIPCRTVSTTGYQLLYEYKGYPLAKYLIDNGYIHNISISRMSFDEKQNDVLMSGQNISNQELERLLTFFKLNGAEARISCNLLPNGVNSLDLMLQFLRDQNQIGADSVMFRQIEGNFPKIDIKPIFEELKNNELFTYVETLNGMFYYVDIFEYTDIITHKTFLVKCYHTVIPTEKDIISSMTFNHGALRDGFSGPILADYT